MHESRYMGEANSRPHVRTCSFREEHCQQLVRGCVRGLTNDAHVPEHGAVWDLVVHNKCDLY